MSIGARHIAWAGLGLGLLLLGGFAYLRWQPDEDGRGRVAQQTSSPEPQTVGDWLRYAQATEDPGDVSPGDEPLGDEQAAEALEDGREPCCVMPDGSLGDCGEGCESAEDCANNPACANRAICLRHSTSPTARRTLYVPPTTPPLRYAGHPERSEREQARTDQRYAAAGATRQAAQARQASLRQQELVTASAGAGRAATVRVERRPSGMVAIEEELLLADLPEEEALLLELPARETIALGQVPLEQMAALPSPTATGPVAAAPGTVFTPVETSVPAVMPASFGLPATPTFAGALPAIVPVAAGGGGGFGAFLPIIGAVGAIPGIISIIDSPGGGDIIFPPYTPYPPVIPEPGTWAVIVAGLALLIRRQRQ